MKEMSKTHKKKVAWSLAGGDQAKYVKILQEKFGLGMVKKTGDDVTVKEVASGVSNLHDVGGVSKP